METTTRDGEKAGEISDRTDAGNFKKEAFSLLRFLCSDVSLGCRHVSWSVGRV